MLTASRPHQTQALARPARDTAFLPGLPFRLLTVDIWRVHGLLFVLLAVALSGATIRTGWTPGVVFWSEVTRAGAEASWMVAVAAAGFGAWTAGRNRRTRHVSEMTGVVPAAGWATELSLLLAALYWPLLTQLLILGGLTVYGWRYATFGGPYIDVWLVTTLGIIVCVLAGFLVGRVWSQPLVAAGSLGMAFAVLVVLPTLDELRAPIVELVNPDIWRYRALWVEIGWTMVPQVLWFYLALVVLGIVLWVAAWIPRILSVLTIAAVTVAVVVTGSGAAEVWSRQHSPNPVAPAGPPALRSDFDLRCREFRGIEMCLHPAYESLRDDVEATIGPQVTMFGGLAGMPSGIRQSPGTEYGFTVDSDQLAFSLHDSASARRVSLDVAFAVFPYPSDIIMEAPVPGRFTAAQLVVLHVFNPENSGSFPTTEAAANEPLNPFQLRTGEGEAGSSVPRESGVVYEYWNTDAYWDAMGADWYPEMHWAAIRFAALSPEQQRAWLEANWDALRSGELTLKDLP